MCPDWESNQRPFGSQAGTQSTELHQPGLYLLILHRQTDRHTLTCCSTDLWVHWLLLVCALTEDSACYVGVLGWHSNQMSYPTRAWCIFKKCSLLPASGFLFLWINSLGRIKFKSEAGSLPLVRVWGKWDVMLLALFEGCPYLWGISHLVFLPVFWRCSAPASVAQLVGMLTCKLKGCGFDSWSGHMPKLRVRFRSGRMRDATDRYFSHIDVSLLFFLPPPINKTALRWGFKKMH